MERAASARLHDLVLERLVAHDDDPAADGERVECGRHRPAQHAELVVDLDAERLEGALGGVATGTAGGGRDRLAHQLGQPRGAGEAARRRARGRWRRRSARRTARRRTP